MLAAKDITPYSKSNQLVIFINMLQLITFFLFSILMLNHFDVYADEPPNIGNFSLPTSQQPGPFFAFGQNIIDKNEIQVFFEPSYLRVFQQKYPTLQYSFIYGVSENASLLFSVPYAVNYYDDGYSSSGFSDLKWQLEYAYYNASTNTYSDQATIVGAVTAPTGSIDKNPPTGFGSASIFVGGTYNRTYIDWFYFISVGATYITPTSLLSVGPEYLYQAGISKTFASQTDKYLFLGLIEIDGQYFQKSKVLGLFDPNSGGNILFFTPSLWYSTKHLSLQLGISLPMTQSWNGNQDNVTYNLSANIGWSFY